MLKSTGKFLCFIATAAALVCGIQGQLNCVTSTNLSCTEGSARGLIDSIETRLIFSMSFICSGKIVGWTVSGRLANETQYPKLQVWRANTSRGSDFYFKPGNDIQVDAQGTACDIITETCGQVFQCRLSVANQVSVEPGDILGVELPPTFSSGFDLFFIGGLQNTQDHYIFRQQLGSTVRTSEHEIRQRGDHLLISLEIKSETLPTLITAKTVATDATTTTKELAKMESASTTERNTMIALVIGLSMGWFFVGAMISIAITVFVIVTLRVRRRNSETQSSVNTTINNKKQIEMTENECYDPINTVYEEPIF